MSQRHDDFRRFRDDGWVPRDQGTRGGDYDWDEPGQGEGAGGPSFREDPRSRVRGGSHLGSGQGFGSQDYSRNYHYADRAPGGRGMGGHRPGGDRPRGGRSQDSYASGRDFGGQGGYGGGYGESAGGDYRGQRAGGLGNGDHSYWGDGGRGHMAASAPGRGAAPGNHRGKGPKGWKRADERIQEDVCERLADDHEIDASGITVSTRDGVVTLEGSVGHRAIKHRVEDVVERCGGVVDVRNHLAVRRPGDGDGGATPA